MPDSDINFFAAWPDGPPPAEIAERSVNTTRSSKYACKLEPIGQKVTWKSNWTAITSPGKKAHSWIKYGVGIDETQELIELATEVGFIKKAGAWFNLQMNEDEESIKFHGVAKVYEYLKSNPEFFEKLKIAIYGMIS